MANYCLVRDNFCVQTFTPPEGYGIEDCFTPEVAAMFEIVPDWVEANATRDEDGIWHPRENLVIELPEES